MENYQSVSPVSLPQNVADFIKRSLAGLPVDRGDRIKRRLAEIPDAVPTAIGDVMKLPFDLIAYIGEILRDEADGLRFCGKSRRALAELNQTSREVRAITLSALYATTFYNTERELLQSVMNGSTPSGWKYTNNFKGSFDDTTNLRTVFPRLEMMSYQKENDSEAEERIHVHVELFGPITLEELHARSRSPWTDPTYYALCVMGTRVLPHLELVLNRNVRNLDLHEIVALVVHPGGGIMSPDGEPMPSSSGSSWLEMSSEITLAILDPIPGPHARSTMEVLLKFARQVPKTAEVPPRQEDQPVFNEILRLQCLPSALSCFVELASRVSFCCMLSLLILVSLRMYGLQLALGDLPSVDLDIYIKQNTASDEDILGHLHNLGEIFSSKWRYDKNRSAEAPFVTIVAQAEVPLQLARALGYSSDGVNVSLVGTLDPGQDATDNGFQTHLLTRTDFNDIGDLAPLAEPQLVESYPCTHVPVPTGWIVEP